MNSQHTYLKTLGLILLLITQTLFIRAQAPIWSNDFSNAGDWIIGAPNVQGQWEIVSTTPSGIVHYIGAMASTTASNGFGMFNGLQYLLGGPVDFQNATLTYNGTLDFSAYTDLEISFEQRYRKFNVDETLVEFSVDGGATWTTYPVNTDMATNEPSVQNRVSVNISSSVAGESAVTFRFRWLSPSNDNTFGSGYAWMVDDVLFDIPDDEDPEITCTATDLSVDTDPDECTYTHVGTDWNATATDNRSVASIEYELTGATTGTGTSLDGVAFNLGETTVTWTATDGSGNTDVCSFTVTVADETAPEVLTRNVIVALGADGHAAITPEMIDNGSNDACGIAELTLDKTDFAIGDLGAHTVTLTATDHNGNDNSATATVVVVAFDDATFEYDGTAKFLSLAGEGDLPGGVDVNYTGNGQTDADVYEVTVAILGGADYNDLKLTAELTITQATSVITADAVQQHEYDGTVKNVAATLNHKEAALQYSPQRGYTEVGEYTITVSVPETNNYTAANTEVTLIITTDPSGKAASVIKVEAVQEHVYDGTVKNVVATLNHNEAALQYSPQRGYTEVGEYTITVSAPETENYLSASREVTLVITAPSGREDAVITAETVQEHEYDGTVKNVTAALNHREATLQYSPQRGYTEAGEYTITISAPETGNYLSASTAVRLVVHKAQQAITLNAPSEVNRNAGSIQLDVSATSGLPVSLSVDDPQVATLEGGTLYIHRLGTVRVTATQEGDNNHEPAEPITVTIRVIDPSSDFAVRVHPAVSPNGDGINDFLMIEGIKDYPDNKVIILSRNGTILWEAEGYDNANTVFRGTGAGGLQLAPGTYFYSVEIRVNGRLDYRKGYFGLRY